MIKNGSCGGLIVTGLSLLFGLTLLPVHAQQAGLAWVTFNEQDFSRPDATGVDPQLNHDTGKQFQDYAKFWSGYLKVPATGEITIEAEADNGLRLMLNGKLVLNGWAEGSARSATITGKKGESLPMHLEYFQDGGIGYCRLFWKWPGHERELIPASAFSHDAADETLIEQLKKGELEVADVRYQMGGQSVAQPIVLEKTISREHAMFDGAGKRMSVGRDGRVYIVNGDGYWMRLNRDGSNKMGLKTQIAGHYAAANERGQIAVGFGGSGVNTYDANLRLTGTIREFGGESQYNWYEPSDVEVGPSGEFYAVHQTKSRIVRLAAPYKVITTYSLDGTGEKFINRHVLFRVVESLERFYIATNEGKLHALGFDGKLIWTIPFATFAEGGPDAGVWDADDEGNIYHLLNNTDTIQVLDSNGKPKGTIPLKMGQSIGHYRELRLDGDEVFIKRSSRVELFQVYDRKTGALKHAVPADFERLKTEFGSAVWTAGQPVTVSTTIETKGQTTRPAWPAEFARYNDPGWTALPVVDGKVTAPADASGLYRVRVGYGEYRQEAVVEVRVPDSKGTVNILTPLNRIYYGHGEEIPVKVIVRGDKPDKLKFELRAGDSAVWSTNLSLSDASFTLPAAAFRPGKYLLTADAPGFTVAPQPLIIGPGFDGRPAFSIVQYIDGAGEHTGGTYRDAPESVANHIAHMRRMGQNLFVGQVGSLGGKTEVEPVVKQLQKDPRGVAPEKAEIETATKQTLAAYGAFGMEQLSVLLGMDTMIPFSADPAENARMMEGYQKGIQAFMTQVRDYPAFRGWSWAGNWWIDRERATPDEQARKQWRELRATVLKTGQWDPTIERFTDPVIAVPAEAEQMFDSAQQQVLPGAISAMTGPARQPLVIPTITMRNADEIDLQLQLEQLWPPQLAPHIVDFYRRPGKRVWGHPEVPADDGTGGTMLPTVLQMVMRGVDGTGPCGGTPNWVANKPVGPTATGLSPADPRWMATGGTSVGRALLTLLRQYGPWFTTLEANDPLAIVVSTRMLRLDDWDGGIGGGGVYYTQLYEAYQACLYAHRPATFAFTEEVKPDTLKKFKAVLVVGQKVELDPPLVAALANAQSIFYDETCRKEWVKGFKPLHITFDRIRKEPAQWNDESSHYRWPRYFRDYAVKLTAALGATVPPVAEVANPGIMLSERRTGEGRFVWAVNNDQFTWEPGIMWRVAAFNNQRVPQTLPIGLSASGQTVYEVFSMRPVTEPVADLRLMPARLFAVLPKPIESVKVSVPDKVKAGETFQWKVAVAGPKMSYPLQMRFVDEAGQVIKEFYPTKPTGSLTLPVNVASVTLEARELISGKSAQATINPKAVSPRHEAGAMTVESLFGPHLRDIALSADGATALINAANWDDNFYMLDTATGNVRSQGRVGSQYGFGPVAVRTGFFLQGFDLASAEGFHLYQLGADGKPQRRFALFGIPGRGLNWNGGGKTQERINHFAVAPNGSWIASAGNLGLIVWSGEGKKLWTKEWWKERRQSMLLLALNDETLVTIDSECVATAWRASAGKQLWQVKLANIGVIRGGAVSADGKTLVVHSDTEGGRTFVVRDGKVVCTLPLNADQVRLTPDGRFMAVAIVGSELRWYSTAGELLWSFTSDNAMASSVVSVSEPRISLDGKRVAFASHTGLLWVLDDQGRKLLECDMGALPVTKWLANGDLLVATWMGQVMRLDAAGNEKWRTSVQPKGTVVQTVVADAPPTVRATWGSAADKPGALSPNLLKEAKFTMSPAPENPVELLFDGHTDAPLHPWLKWNHVAHTDSGWVGKMPVAFDFGQKTVRLTGITFVEDPAHPESWMRDALLQYWDAAKAAWIDGPYLLSDAVTHTHYFEQPIESSQFRFIGKDMFGWPTSNLRWGELVFHGEITTAVTHNQKGTHE